MMKRTALFLLSLLMILSLCACGAETDTDRTYTVERSGKIFTVDPDAQTISDGKHTYGYTLSAGGTSAEVEITYPNGATYYWTWRGNVGTGGRGGDYDETLYTDGMTLCDIVMDGAPAPDRAVSPGKLFLIIFAIPLGIFNIVWPQAAWYLEYGWRFRDAEPSDLALFFNRFGGIVLVIVGVVAIFV